MPWPCSGSARAATPTPAPRRHRAVPEVRKELADAVEDAMKEKMTPLSAKLTTKYKEITLELDTLPDMASGRPTR